MLYANIQINNAHLANVHMGATTDPCIGKSIGQACTGGAIYAGTGYNSGGLNPILRYMVTPGGCTDEICTGAGGTDSVQDAWANDSGTTAYNVNTGATDLNNGKRNTAMISPYYTDTDAAHWCTQMNYGGYSDWYLPSQNELNILFVNKAALGGFALSAYWTSTEFGPVVVWVQHFVVAGTQNTIIKTATNYTRCIRSY